MSINKNMFIFIEIIGIDKQEYVYIYRDLSLRQM